VKEAKAAMNSAIAASKAAKATYDAAKAAMG